MELLSWPSRFISVKVSYDGYKVDIMMINIVWKTAVENTVCIISVTECNRHSEMCVACLHPVA